MGHNKSKHLSLVDCDNSLRLDSESGRNHRNNRQQRRKWRKKQGYSLPTGLDMVGRGSAVSAASSHTDLPDIDQDDAILVSYSQSNAEKFTHLRPRYQRHHQRASSEEPKAENEEHVHVIHISDTTCNPAAAQQRRESSPSAVSVVSIRQPDSSPEPSEETTEDILLNVIENSFKDDEKLQPEDFDILKCLNVVPEPSIVMLDTPSEEQKEQIAPPSPYANEAQNRISQDYEESDKEVSLDSEELLSVEEEEATPAESISVQVIIEDDGK